MASAYQKEFVMPEEFPATLRDFTREVLRDQPEDVAKYGYEYFLRRRPWHCLHAGGQPACGILLEAQPLAGL